MTNPSPIQRAVERKFTIEKSDTIYKMQLDASTYDFLEVVESAEDKRITIKFLDTRWRTVKETTDMLEEIINALKTL